jgi:hypothetical protein
MCVGRASNHQKKCQNPAKKGKEKEENPEAKDKKKLPTIYCCCLSQN